MPRIDHHVTPEAVLPYEAQMLLTILLAQLNVLRTRAGMAPLTAHDMRQAVKNHLKTHPRIPPGQGG